MGPPARPATWTSSTRADELTRLSPRHDRPRSGGAVVLRPAIPAAPEPIEQHDDEPDHRNTAEHEKCGRHRLSPDNANVISINTPHVAMPATPTPNEKASWPTA